MAVAIERAGLTEVLSIGIETRPSRSRSRCIIMSSASLPSDSARTCSGGVPCRCAQPESDGNEDEQRVHLAAPARRSELPMTTSELNDMAIAAMSGVTAPASASGMASML